MRECERDIDVGDWVYPALSKYPKEWICRTIYGVRALRIPCSRAVPIDHVLRLLGLPSSIQEACAAETTDN